MKNQANDAKNKSTEDVKFLNEEERLRNDIYRPDIEKLQLFTRMLRLNNLFKGAQITHKNSAQP